MAQLPIYVINLRRSTARREHIRSQLDSLNLDYELVHEPPGERAELLRIVDAAKRGAPGPDDSALCDADAIRRHPQWLIPGAIGCTLSHNRIYRTILAEDTPNALILEDDVQLSPEVATIVRDIEPFQGIARNSMLLLVGIGQAASKVPFARASRVSANGLTAYRVADPQARVGCSSAYVVSGEVAARLLAANSPVKVVCDAWPHLRAAGAIDDIYAFLPFPARPAFYASELGYPARGSGLLKLGRAMSRVAPVRSMLRLRRYLNWRRRSRYALR